MSEQRILITGAAGRVGTMLRSRLAREGRALRLLDIAPQPPGGPGENAETVRASLTDPAALLAACREVDAVVHLGALSTEAAWEDLLAVNIDGTRKLLEAMRQQGVGRLVLASSVHAAGFRTRAEADPAPGAGLAAETVPRPDTYYGVSKAATEALASLYHSRFGLDVSCLRIGGLHPHPVSPEDLAVWLSPDDGGRLVEACLGSHPPGFRILWGISRNTRRWWSLAEAEALGYAPQDDAEHWADRILADARFDPAAPRNFLAGGHFCALPLGEPAPAWPPR